MTATPVEGPRPASIGRRFGAYVIDQLPMLLASVLVMVGVLASVSAGSLGSASALLVVLWLAALAYGIFVWGWTATRGLTPGKRALRLRVVSATDGRPIGWGRAFLRQLVLGLITAGTAGIGAVVLAAVASKDPRRQGWHDKAAGSIVLDERGAGAPLEAAPDGVERPASGVVPVGLPRAAPVRSPAAEPFPVHAVPLAPPPSHREPVPASGALSSTSTAVIAAVPGLVDDVPGVSAAPAPAPAPVPVRDDGNDGDDVGHTRLSPVRRTATGPWRLDTGAKVVEVRGVGLIGRAPEPRPDEQVEHLIAVDDPQRSVSKTHLEFGVDDRGFWVRDRGSTNGSAVLPAGATRLACPPGVTVHVAAGSIVLVGDHELRVDRS
jgi:uncharacterized RDD family membrane protein YckC